MSVGPLVARWLKFNGAGLLGVGVQLATLAALTGVAKMNYLLATALAVEIAVLHNFVWHEKVTWAERAAIRTAGVTKQVQVIVRLLKFNLSNGAVSIVGNVLLMKSFVEGAHVPYLLANFLAILICSTANFFLCELFVFRNRRVCRQNS